jgi:DNA-directed RNA polymerase subunit F
MDKEKRDRIKGEIVFEAGKMIETKVYKISPEQKEELEHISDRRLEQMREEATTKIRERYEQLIRSRQQHLKGDEVE